MPSKYGFEKTEDKLMRQQQIETLLMSLSPIIEALAVDVLTDLAAANRWAGAEVIGGKDKERSRWVWSFHMFPEFSSQLENWERDNLPQAIFLSRDSSTPELYVSMVSSDGRNDKIVQQVAAVLRHQVRVIPSLSNVKVTTSRDL